MHIWQIDPVSLTPYYDLSLCDALACEGHSVHYITSRYLYDPALVYPANVTVDLSYFRMLSHPMLTRTAWLRRLLRALAYPFGHRRVIAALRANRPDVVHIQWSRFPRFDRLLARAVKARGIPLVHTVHDVEPLFAQGAFAGSAEEVYSHVDAFVVHTEENRTRFLMHHPGISQDKVHVIAHLLPSLGADDLPGFDRQDARAMIGADQAGFHVLLFGNIKSYKGLDVLASAIPLVHAVQPNITFCIVGKPEEEADRLLLERLAGMSGVRVIAEYIPSDLVWAYHRAADLVVFPYHQISQSGALATALGFGCAVIATRVGGLPDLIGQDGWLIPPGDPAALADAILHAASQPAAALEELRVRARQSAEARFSPRAIARQHAALYATLIAAGQ